MPPREKQVKPIEPEYEWGDCPAGAPTILWEHAARPLWVQASPGAGGVLLLEKERVLFRRIPGGEQSWSQAAAPPDDVVEDGSGFVLATGQEVTELEPGTGHRRWTAKMGGSVQSLALDPRTAYTVVTQRTSGHVFALNRQDGKSRWRAPAHGDATLLPYPDAGVVLVSDPDREEITAYEPERGARLWIYNGQAQPLIPGPVAAGLCLISEGEAGVAALDLHTGEERWRFRSGGVFETAPVLFGGRVFAADGSLHALDPASGERIWERTLADDVDRFFAARVEGEVVLAESWKGRVYRLNPETGTALWKQSLGQVHGAASDARRLYLRVCLQEPDGWAVVALERETGKPAWELRARRLVPDVTLVGEALVVELRQQVLVLGVGQ